MAGEKPTLRVDLLKGISPLFMQSRTGWETKKIVKALANEIDFDSNTTL